MLGEDSNLAKAIRLVLKDDSTLAIDGMIQKDSEQINWTNTTIKGLEMNMVRTSEKKNKEMDSLSVVVHSVNKNLNDVSFAFFV